MYEVAGDHLIHSDAKVRWKWQHTEYIIRSFPKNQKHTLIRKLYDILLISHLISPLIFRCGTNMFSFGTSHLSFFEFSMWDKFLTQKLKLMLYCMLKNTIYGIQCFRRYCTVPFEILYTISVFVLYWVPCTNKSPKFPLKYVPWVGSSQVRSG